MENPDAMGSRALFTSNFILAGWAKLSAQKASDQGCGC
jgi:hypothetical protein